MEDSFLSEQKEYNMKRKVKQEELRQGIGDELWVNLPAHKRERQHELTGGIVGPCGRIDSKININHCNHNIHPVMCKACKDRR